MPVPAATYVFLRDEGGADNWGEMKKLIASDAEAGDNFGVKVAVSGSTTVVGAQNEDTGGSNAGAAYVFQEPLPPQTPTPTVTITPTVTPTPPPPVGGIALDPDLSALALEKTESSSSSFGVLAWAIAAAAGVALGGAAWYARRRVVR